MHTHFTRDMSGNLMSVFQLYTKHRIRQCLDYNSVLFYCRLLCHIIILNCFISQNLFDKIERGKDVGLSGSYRDRMLKVSGTFTVSSPYSPAVTLHNDLTFTLCYHWFNGNAHSPL